MIWYDRANFYFKKVFSYLICVMDFAFITLHLFSSKLCKQPIAEQLGGQASHGGRDFSPN